MTLFLKSVYFDTYRLQHLMQKRSIYMPGPFKATLIEIEVKKKV